MMNHRMTALALALGSAVLLAGCGGGGGGGGVTGSAGGGTTPPSSTLAMSVTPTLGYFFSGTVSVTDASGNTVGTGTVTNGAVQLQVPASYTGSTLIVKVTGGTYWDEALGRQVTQTQPLYALIPSFSSASNTVAVNPLTNAAAALLLQSNGTLPASTSSSAVVQANSTVAALFGLSGIDLVSTVPTPIKSATDTLSGTSPSDLVEAKLAALALLAKNDQTSADGEAVSLAQILAGSVSNSSSIVSSAALGGFATSLNAVTSAAVANLAGGDPAVEDGLDSSAYQAVSGALPPAMQSAITSGSASPLLSEVGAAKAFFSALRTGVLPYANPMAGTGVLNVRLPELGSELAPLGQGLNGVHELADMVNLVLDQVTGATPNLPCYYYGGNTVGAVAGQLTCYLPNSNTETLTLYTSPFLSTGSSTWTWKLSTGLTGTLTLNQTTANGNPALEIIANGQLDPSTAQGSYTQIGVGNTAINSCQQPMQALDLVVPTVPTGAPTWSALVQGNIADMVADTTSGRKSCAGYSPDLALYFGGSGKNAMGAITVNHVDPTQDSLEVAASLQTLDYTLQGSLQIPQQLTSGSAGTVSPTGNPVVLDGSVSTGGLQYVSASNTLVAESGSSVTPYTLLDGELKASANLGSGVTAYNPSSPASAVNNLSTAVSFTGQVFDSATDPGLKLVLTWGRSWNAAVGNYADSLQLNYDDLADNLSVSASASANEPNPQVTQVQLTGGNGITATWMPGQASTAVEDGADRVGTLNGGRVSYVDGSYQSVY